jgi:pimeloyl-ACP methyl ester carboxylesterase
MESIRLADGRALSYHAWGPVDGPLLIHQHGVPGSRLELVVVADVIAASGVRVVAVDRPGIGHSDPLPGLGLTGYVADSAALADALGAERFAVSGFSAGGPYALAAAAAFPDRVTSALLLSSAGDPATPHPDKGVVLSERVMGQLAIHQPAVARAFWRLTGPLVHRWPIRFTRPLLHTAPVDDAFFDDEDARAVAIELEESLRQGPAAMVEDYARCYEPWDFDPGSIRSPVVAWHGEDDRLVPMRLAEQLQTEIPGARLIRLPGTGHMGTFRAIGDLLAAVRVSPGTPPAAAH